MPFAESVASSEPLKWREAEQTKLTKKKWGPLYHVLTICLVLLQPEQLGSEMIVFWCLTLAFKKRFWFCFEAGSLAAVGLLVLLLFHLRPLNLSGECGNTLNQPWRSLKQFKRCKNCWSSAGRVHQQQPAPLSFGAGVLLRLDGKQENELWGRVWRWQEFLYIYICRNCCQHLTPFHYSVECQLRPTKPQGASCSAHPGCAGLAGDCCPTWDSQLDLGKMEKTNNFPLVPLDTTGPLLRRVEVWMTQAWNCLGSSILAEDGLNLGCCFSWPSPGQKQSRN